MAARFGVTSELASARRDRVLKNVRDLMRERGVSSQDAQNALTPRHAAATEMRPKAAPQTIEDRIDAIMNDSGATSAEDEGLADDAKDSASSATPGATSGPSEKGPGLGDSSPPVPAMRGAAPMEGRTPGRPFNRFNVLRRLLAEHDVRLSVDPWFVRDNAPPSPSGKKWGPAAFIPTGGGKAFFCIRSDATRFEVLHELGHFVDWLKQGKPDTAGPLTEQAAYDFLRNNKTRWRSLNDAEREHADWYLIDEGGEPNLRKD